MNSLPVPYAHHEGGACSLVRHRAAQPRVVVFEELTRYVNDHLVDLTGEGKRDLVGGGDR